MWGLEPCLECLPAACAPCLPGNTRTCARSPAHFTPRGNAPSNPAAPHLAQHACRTQNLRFGNHSLAPRYGSHVYIIHRRDAFRASKVRLAAVQAGGPYALPIRLSRCSPGPVLPVAAKMPAWLAVAALPSAW